MGTDIHAFIEYRERNKEENSWKSFSYDELLLERDYTMFYILAEARGDAPNSFKAKGKIPINELSEFTRDSRFLFIGKFSEEFEKSLGNCTIEEAIQYKENYGCNIYYVDNIPRWVDDPDFHTDTWLSFSEYEQALFFYKDYTKKMPLVCYMVTYKSMEAFENAGYETRLVIFFDN